MYILDIVRLPMWQDRNSCNTQAHILIFSFLILSIYLPGYIWLLYTLPYLYMAKTQPIRHRSQNNWPKSNAQNVHLSCFCMSETFFWNPLFHFSSVIPFWNVALIIFSPSNVCLALVSLSLTLGLLLWFHHSTDYRHQRKNNRLHPDVSTQFKRQCGRVDTR